MWIICTKWKNLHIPHCERRDSRGSRTSEWLLVQNCTSLAMSRLCWAEPLLQGDGTTVTGVENQPRQQVRGVTEGALRPLHYKGRRRLLFCGCWLKPSFISKKHLTGGPKNDSLEEIRSSDSYEAALGFLLHCCTHFYVCSAQAD